MNLTYSSVAAIVVVVVALAAFSTAALANEPGKTSPPAAQPAPQNAPPEPQDMKPLFNGKDLAGWSGHPKLWTVKDGVIHGETTAQNKAPGNTFLIYTGGDDKNPQTFADFELRLSFKLQGGNSGVQYRSKHLVGHKDNAWVVAGYQAEIAGLPGKDGFLYNEKGPKGRGYASKSNYLAWVGDKVEIGPDGISKVVGSLGENGAIAAALKKTDWNDYVIIAKGNHLQHFINGVQTIDCVDDDARNRASSGIIVFQIHVG
ncbi:MAG TPA: DUF1080 domain-containing protein [Tepidisphaeraceae bacterium]